MRAFNSFSYSSELLRVFVFYSWYFLTCFSSKASSKNNLLNFPGVSPVFPPCVSQGFLEKIRVLVAYFSWKKFWLRIPTNKQNMNKHQKSTHFLNWGFPLMLKYVGGWLLQFINKWFLSFLPSELDLGGWMLQFIKKNVFLEFRGSRLKLYKIMKVGCCIL